MQTSDTDDGDRGVSEGIVRDGDQRRWKERRHHFYSRFCGGALAFCLLMIVGLMLLLAVKGVSFFWPKDIHELTLSDGSRVYGEFQESKEVLGENAGDESHFDVKYKIANRDIENLDFRWIPEKEIQKDELPPDLLRLERQEYGDFLGRILELRIGQKVMKGDASSLLPELRRAMAAKASLRKEILAVERGQVDPLNERIREHKLEIRKLKLRGKQTPQMESRRQELESEIAELQKQSEALSLRTRERTEAGRQDSVLMETAEKKTHSISMMDVLSVQQPNRMSVWAKTGALFGNLWSFVWDEPRESNTEGGIFPAIFGTVLLVFLMTFFVTPFGVLAAIYLREYAKEGPLVRAVRIAIFNLAGVPSIVFGVFGLGFFVYLIGGTLDQLFYPEALPTPTYGTGGILWASLTLALLTVPVVIVATEEALSAVPSEVRQGAYALGSTKFETLWRIIVPASLPGIITGVILAIARAAGEVAPLMLVGVVKLAPSLVDGQFPYLHLDRKFMHLGFHIYDLGFQSPNVEATKPLVYATAFLLVMIVLVMNLVAIYYRNRLRERYASSSI